MPQLHEISVPLDEALAQKLRTAAKEGGWTPESLAADCVAQHLELAIRFLALLERFEQMDSNIAAIASFVGQASAASEGAEDLWKICRWRREHERR
jgi:hypothetical protein